MHVATSPVVPAEFIGQARRLRTNIALAEIAAEQVMKRVWTLVRVTANRHRQPPAAAARLWQRQMPDTGRITRTVEYSRTSLRIDEARLSPTKIRFDNWQGEGMEPSIAIVRFELIADTRQTSIDTYALCEFSLHSVARRFQRGVGDDADVLADIAAMAAQRDTLLANGGEFDVAVGDGRWVGAIVETPSPNGRMESILCIRSYLPARGL
ncbi:MAG TPA: hypothetical protein VFQ90_19955 [Stellaceae bacterium]|jgi:hypothetical protein|nr:hypothetical protein [Stellaceae bacterium]